MEGHGGVRLEVGRNEPRRESRVFCNGQGRLGSSRNRSVAGG